MRLTYFLETNNMLNPLQYGFREMRVTEDVLVRMEGVILDSSAQQKHLFRIFFDTEKAYDATWKFGILQSIQSYGIRGALAYFIRNFLQNQAF